MNYKKIEIYLNKKTGIYIVQPMTKHPTGASVVQGNPDYIQPEDFESKIVVSVLQNLSKYGDNYNKEFVPRYSDQEYKNFLKNHKQVSVLMETDGTIEIVALSGRTGSDGKIYLQKENIEKELLPALKEALNIA